MTTRALCPTCGNTLTVRSDHKLPRHWGSRRSQLAGQDRCEGSELNVRRWSTGPAGVLYQRPKNT